MKKWNAMVILAMLCLGFSSIAQDRLTLEDIWSSRKFSTDYVSGLNSMKDGIHFTTLDYNPETQGMEINKYAYEKSTKKISTLVNDAELKKQVKGISIGSYTFSADEKQVLIATQVDNIYRHSTKAFYYIYDIEKKDLKNLSDQEKGKQRLAAFSPDGSKIAFVRDNNIFYVDLASQQETQVTFDGKYNEIINGATDWVYEEEFGLDRGFFWSPEGGKIAFQRSDESQVKEFQMAMYGSLYPEQYKFKYPKAGEDNCKMDVYIHDLAKGKNYLCETGSTKELYFPRIKWMTEENLCIYRMNRHQNKLEFLKTGAPADGGTVPTEVFYTESSDTYVEVSDDLHFLKDGKSFLWTSEKDGYNHIYKFDLNGKELTQITKGNWDVTALDGVDEENGILYYTSAESSAMERDVFTIKLDGTKKKKLSERKGQNQAVFSEGFKYYINYHSDANTPPYITLHTSSGKQVEVLKDNAKLVETMKGFGLNDKEFFQFTTSEDVSLNGWMIKPKGFDESKKYPVFMTVYNGPGINTVNDSWGWNNYLWHQMLAQEGYIVVSIDGRGTGYRGAEFKKCTYQQLGKYETMDQIEGAKYLAGLSYVDGNRIGIQGWSYGGYMTSLCMTKGADHFKMGIAVAPVTNWRYYDSIYTERYMRTPKENAAGYDDNSPINYVSKLKGPYLLVHGSADDNVHHQNALEMVEALVQANKQFDLFIYPNKNHGIYGGNTRLHLYTKMTNFIKENL